MPTRPQTLAVLAIFLVPAVAAAPIIVESVLTLSGEWDWGSMKGQCSSERVAFTAVHVNSRMLLDAQSSVFGLGGSTAPTSDADCAMPTITHAGVFVNPCHVLNGPARPAVPADPYFHATLTNKFYTQWEKHVAFLDGSWTHLVVAIGAQGIGVVITCESGGLSSEFRGLGSTVAAP